MEPSAIRRSSRLRLTNSGVSQDQQRTNSKTGENTPQHVVVSKNMQRRPKSTKIFYCEVCHKEIITVKNYKIHMQQHFIRDNRGLLNCEHCPQYYGGIKSLLNHYRVNHPPNTVVGDKEFCENSKQTEQEALVKSEPNETDSSNTTVTHNDSIIKKKAEDENDNNLLISEKSASDKEFSEENEPTELVSSMKSEPSSPKSPYVNLEDDIFTVEDINVKTEESYAELNHPSPGLVGSNPEMVNNDPRVADVHQNQQKESYECHEWQVLIRKINKRKKQKRPKSIKTNFCEVCHKEITTTKDGFEIHMQQHFIRDNRGLLNCEHCPQYYASKNGLMRHYREEHPLKRLFVYKEFSEPASDREFSEENELAVLVASMKSEPSSPESPYVNLEDDKFTVGETDEKTEESNAELNNPSPDLIGINPEMVDNNDPRVVDVDQNQQKGSSKCPECRQICMNASCHCTLLCWVCGERFLKMDQLTSHIANHVTTSYLPHLTYMCKQCDKSFMHLSDYKSHYIITHKTHTEGKILTCPSKQVVTNETESSIATDTRRKVKKKKVEEHEDVMYHVILPESAPDCTVTSIATVAHEKVIQKNLEEQEDFMLSEPDSVDRNVPINDTEFCEQSE